MCSGVVKFENITGSARVQIAALNASRLLSPESSMVTELRAKNDWAYGVKSGEQVYQKIKACDKVLPIYIYRPWNIFTRAIGYFDGKAIHLNKYKLKSLSITQIKGLLCHEWLHAAGFNHGTGWRANYKTKHKVNHSVPYYVSENIGRWL